MASLTQLRQGTGRRSAFTLIELLIAILIISVLATLVTLGVMKAMTYAKQVANKTEMGQIEQALGVAAIEMGRVPYFPSFLVLRATPSAYGATPYEQLSKRILTQMFPKWSDATPATWPTANLDATQAYIFFLRGRDGNGFSTGTDPWAAGSGKRFGPYFEFKVDRLDFAPNGLASGYRDYWDNPGKYLAVYSQMMIGQNAAPPGETPAGYPGRQLQAVGKYFSPKGYQIFSAGKDGLWGTYPAGAPFNGTLAPPGDDDQSNFSDDLHGKPVAG